MTELFMLTALVLILSLLLDLLRVLLGPGVGDRMLSTQLIGTAGVGMLLLLSVLLDQPALLHVALLLALLAAVAAAAFTKCKCMPELHSVTGGVSSQTSVSQTCRSLSSRNS